MKSSFSLMFPEICLKRKMTMKEEKDVEIFNVLNCNIVAFLFSYL